MLKSMEITRELFCTIGNKKKANVFRTFAFLFSYFRLSQNCLFSIRPNGDDRNRNACFFFYEFNVF